MSGDKGLPERVARLEAIAEQYDSRITTIEKSVKELNNHISEVNANLSSLTTSVTDLKNTFDDTIKTIRKEFNKSIDDLKEDVKEKDRKNMWRIGLLVGSILTGVNIAIGIILHFL